MKELWVIVLFFVYSVKTGLSHDGVEVFFIFIFMVRDTTQGGNTYSTF